MRLPFCDHHITAFLKAAADSPKPLDLALSEYLRAHKSIGAHDRRTIGDTLYGMMRWRSLIDYFCQSPAPQDRLYAFRRLSLEDCWKDPSIPESIRFGFTDFLYDKFRSSYGAEKGVELCRVLNGQAPTTIRVNRLKATRDELMVKWGGRFSISPCAHAPNGIQFHKKEPLFSLPEFKEGFFEVQDEGSQLVAELVDAKPGNSILDYCSGSGGKTLSFAPSTQGKGQIYLHDIRAWILQEARKRLKRAGIQNAQYLPPGHPQLLSIRGKMDWVLTDVPCTGTGTLRRNPDAKWKIDELMVERLVLQQREIVGEALAYVKPGGRLVYATCSILPEENERQVEFMLANYPLVLEKNPIALLPQENGMDGFFAAVFKRDALI